MALKPTAAVLTEGERGHLAWLSGSPEFQGWSSVWGVGTARVSDEPSG